MHEYAMFAVTIALILAGILSSRSGMSGLREEMNGLRGDMKEGFGNMDEGFRGMNGRLDKIQDDLNALSRLFGLHDEAIDALKKRGRTENTKGEV